MEKNLSIEVKKKLIEMGKYQYDLANAVGCSENYLTDILQGRRSGKAYREKILQYVGITDGNDKNTFEEVM